MLMALHCFNSCLFWLLTVSELLAHLQRLEATFRDDCDDEDPEASSSALGDAEPLFLAESVEPNRTFYQVVYVDAST